jgi:CheY-like chemotaxis protein
VLVLEDNELIVKLLQRVLTPRGWTVVSVPDGLHAFEQLNALPFLAVIADEVLPRGPRGSLVLERIHRLYWETGIRLAWLSGYVPSDETRALLRRIGAVELRKGEAFIADIIDAIEGPPDAA